MDTSIRKQAMTASWEAAASYHQQTKHYFHRCARSLGYMDWANQPDPFQQFISTPPVRLEFCGLRHSSSVVL